MIRFVHAAAALAVALQAGAAHAQYHAQLIEKSKAWGTAIADYNGDGHDDIFITGHDTDDRIWYWTLHGYAPSAQVLEYVDRHDCVPADFNRDGRMDFYCAVGADRGNGEGPNELWLQDASGIFQLASGHGAEDPFGSARIPVVLDVNHDGWPDIYLTNEKRVRDDGNLSINRLFVNQGGTGFVEVATAATGERGSACAAAGDIDGDGWDDLLVCDADGPPHVYLNDRAGGFAEVFPAPVASQWRSIQLRDLNHDGRLDLVALVEGNDLQVWLNNGTQGLYDVPAYVNHLTYAAKALTVGDFNRDGRPDIYVVVMNADCPQNLNDLVPDVLFVGLPNGSWAKQRLPETYAGCGHLADTVDGDKVLLMNGGISWVGPNYLLTWLPLLHSP